MKTVTMTDEEYSLYQERKQRDQEAKEFEQRESKEQITRRVTTYLSLNQWERNSDWIRVTFGEELSDSAIVRKALSVAADRLFREHLARKEEAA